MPYIKPERRMLVGTDIEPATPGELNYMLTTVILRYIDTHKGNYETYNAILGVLEAVKLELYRRRIAPYEDQKIKENGDVF